MHAHGHACKPMIQHVFLDILQAFSWSHAPCRGLLIINFLFRFDYYGIGADDLSKVKQTLFMFIDLFGLENFDYNTLARKLRIKLV